MARHCSSDAGATSRLGSVDEGNSVLDFDPDEVSRKLTLNTTLASLETPRGKINLLDTPGFSSYLGDSKAACRVADAALFVVSAATGVKFETDVLWRAADENALPRMIVVTKMDRERASVAKVLEDAEKLLGVRPVPLQSPIGSEAAFRQTRRKRKAAYALLACDLRFRCSFAALSPEFSCAFRALSVSWAWA